MSEYFLTVPHETADEPTMESMQDFDPAELEALIQGVEAFNSDLKASGGFRYAGGLQPPSTAKTVDASTDPVGVEDAPFVDAPSYVGGFWIIDVADEHTAVEWATRASSVLQSRVEVRALQEEPGE